MLRRVAGFVANNAVGLLALFVALGGVSYAATGGFASGGRLQACVGRNGALTLLKGAKKCRRGQQKVVWSQTGPRGPAGPAGASGLSGATGANGTISAKVTSAETAVSADNALSLGGIPASGYTRSDCASTTGQIKGFVLVPKEPTVSPETAGISYNCSGGAVIVGKYATGRYVVKFENNPATIAVATANQNASDSVSATRIGAGEWNLVVFNSQHQEEEAAPIAMILP